MDRALDGMEMSRWDKFGTEYDRWMQGHKYDSKPSWKIFVGLSQLLGSKMKFNMAEDIFAKYQIQFLLSKDLITMMLESLGFN